MKDDDELPSLEELGKSIQSAKEKHEEKPASSSSGGALRTSVDLLSGVIIGSVAGYYLDKWLGTLPIFFLICFFLGVAGSGLNIYRSTQRNSNNDN